MTSAYAADPVFESNPKQIGYLLLRAFNRELALPEFQRDFVWEVPRTIELIRSVMCRYPTGTLLFWKQNDDDSTFAARAIVGAPDLGEKRPDELVLDGQQRLTALYRALNGIAPEKYFVRLNSFLSDSGDVLQVHEIDFDRNPIFAIDTSGKIKFDPMNPEWQRENCAFPLHELNQFDEWLDNYASEIAERPSEEGKIKKRMRAVRDAYLVPLKAYGFPVVTLPASTPLEAVCNIFETLNRTGKPLGAFDLLTAKLYPQDINLRDLWEEALGSNLVLAEFKVEPYALLQAVCLRAYSSAQRADVLRKVKAVDIKTHWTAVVSGAVAALNQFKSQYGVLNPKWLPYSMLLVPLAAIWQEIRALKTLERGEAYARMAQYFWCTTFMTNFDQGANSQAGADYIKLKSWLLDETAEPPEAVKNFSLTASSLRLANVRRKALHAGVMALTIRSGAKDFHTATNLTADTVKDKQVESHHIFPKAYLSDTTVSELILNRALIDGETNRAIGKQAPSVYLKKMRDAQGTEKVEDVLESHAISIGESSGIENDDYQSFLDERLASMIALIEVATGMSVSRDDAP